MKSENLGKISFDRFLNDGIMENHFFFFAGIGKENGGCWFSFTSITPLGESINSVTEAVSQANR